MYRDQSQLRQIQNWQLSAITDMNMHNILNSMLDS